MGSNVIVPDETDNQMAFSDMIEPKHRMRKSGLYPTEEAALKVFALSDSYPRELTVERTGTKYILRGPEGARRLLKGLRFGSEESRWNLTENRSKPTPRELRAKRLF